MAPKKAFAPHPQELTLPGVVPSAMSSDVAPSEAGSFSDCGSEQERSDMENEDQYRGELSDADNCVEEKATGSDQEETFSVVPTKANIEDIARQQSNVAMDAARQANLQQLKDMQKEGVELGFNDGAVLLAAIAWPTKIEARLEVIKYLLDNGVKTAGSNDKKLQSLLRTCDQRFYNTFKDSGYSVPERAKPFVPALEAAKLAEQAKKVKAESNEAAATSGLSCTIS